MKHLKEKLFLFLRYPGEGTCTLVFLFGKERGKIFVAGKRESTVIIYRCI